MLSIKKSLALLAIALPVMIGAENFCPKSLEEKAVYETLGPIYRQIFVHALNDEQRHRVVVYVRKGLNPYEALNTILRVEERKYLRGQLKQKFTPAESSWLQTKRKGPAILFEEER